MSLVALSEMETSPTPNEVDESTMAEDKLRVKLGVVAATFKRGQQRLAIVDTALQS